MSVKGTKRKTSAEFAEEHVRFIALIKEKRPELEIMQKLGLSRVQFDAHVLLALKKKKVIQEDLSPAYEVVRAKSLPSAIRERLLLDSKDDAEMLVKVEPKDEGVFLIPLVLLEESY